MLFHQLNLLLTKVESMFSCRLSLPLVLMAAGLFWTVGCEPKIPVNNSTPSSTEGSATTSSDGKGLKRIIILTNGDAPFWDACRQGALAANDELKLKEMGLIAAMDVNDASAQGQLSKLQQYGTQSDIAGVGISAVDADNVAIADQLKTLQSKGIKVITIDSDLNREKFSDARFAFVGTDNLTGGQALGTCAKALRPDGGEYVTFVGMTGAQNAIERIGGFADGAGEKFVNKGSMEDNYDKTKAREDVRNAIRNHPGLGILVGIWSYNAPAIVDIVKEVNRRKDFAIVTFDAEPTAISAMGEGNIDAMVVQNPYEMGFQGARLLAALVADKKDVIAEMLPKHGQPGGDIYDTGLKVVVPNAESPIKPVMFGKSVQFVTLEQLQDWMKKYGLTGS